MRILVATLLCLQSLMYMKADARPLIADLSERVISIDTRFTGDHLLLYGARNQPGNIVILVTGPSRDYVVRKKARVFGIWMNVESVDFLNTNSFYFAASSQPLALYKNNAFLESLGLYIHDPFVKIPAVVDDVATPPFKQALLEQFESHYLYGKHVQEVSFLEKTLFRVVIPFPKLVPEGTYVVNVYLVSDGDLAAQQVIPVIIERAGFDAMIYDLAHQNPLSYGSLAILVALFTGWFIRIVFNRFVGQYRRLGT